jgi:hypothetical protein
MSPTDRKAFAQLLSDAMAFYRQDVSDFTLGVWWEACKGFDLEQVSKALTAHALDPDRGQFAPKPADMVRVLAGTSTDRALLAWSAVHGAMSSAGAYASVDFRNAAIHAAIVDLGGWPMLCRSTLDELPHLQRRFCEAFRVYAKRPGEFEAPLYLAGDHEVENRAKGRAVAPPQLIAGSHVEQRRTAIGQTQAPLALGKAA